MSCCVTGDGSTHAEVAGGGSAGSDTGGPGWRAQLAQLVVVGLRPVVGGGWSPRVDRVAHRLAVLARVASVTCQARARPPPRRASLAPPRRSRHPRAAVHARVRVRREPVDLHLLGQPFHAREPVDLLESGSDTSPTMSIGAEPLASDPPASQNPSGAVAPHRRARPGGCSSRSTRPRTRSAPKCRPARRAARARPRDRIAGGAGSACRPRRVRHAAGSAPGESSGAPPVASVAKEGARPQPACSTGADPRKISPSADCGLGSPVVGLCCGTRVRPR